MPRSLVHADPWSTRPGVANFAGASGPMAIGVGGAAGDAYDALRHYLPDPALGPHGPTTAKRAQVPRKDG